MALYQLKCELKPCEICNEWIEETNKLIIIKHKHYHKDCIISLYRLSLCKSWLEQKNCPSVPSSRPSLHSQS